MLTLINIQKTFPESVSPTLKGINITLSEGEFCIIIGSNGSGKSTLMKSISGEYGIDSGNIKINQIDITLCDRYQLIASVTQDTNKGTIPELTLLENMVLSLSRGKAAKLNFYKRKRATVLSIIQTLEMGLEHYIDAPLKSLSGGQRQMISVLMAISSKPQILLLDEHTSALDPKTQRKLMQYTAASVEKHAMTTMMITHKLDDAITYGNRLIMLHQGCIVLDVKNKEKEALTADALLALFHQYEDENLISQEAIYHE